MTEGSRCLAFDVLDGHVVYAAYRDGKTAIVEQRPDESESTLFTLPPETALYSLSLISKDTMLLSLATPRCVRLAVLSGDQLHYLWNDKEVMDPQYAGDNRIVFASTISGAPQIYWADLGGDATTWYQITAAPAGARFPCVDSLNAGRLFFSVFEYGGYRLYAADNAFSKDHPVQIGGETVADPPPDSPAEDTVQSSGAFLSPILGYPDVACGIGLTRYPISDYETQSIFTPEIDINESLYDAPGDLGVNLDSGRGCASLQRTIASAGVPRFRVERFQFGTTAEQPRIHAKLGFPLPFFQRDHADLLSPQSLCEQRVPAHGTPTDWRLLRPWVARRHDEAPLQHILLGA